MKVDTLSWITKESQMTTSQESYLRKCPFAGQPEIIQCDDNDSDSSSVRIIMVASPPASPGHGDAKCSLPDNNSSNTESTLDILLGLKSLSSGEDEFKEEHLTYDLRSSDKGKEPMVNHNHNHDEYVQIPETLDLTKNPIVDEQVKPTTTTENEIFNNILGALKIVAGDHGDNVGGSDEVDFLETAKKRGMSFPRPRWWKDIMPCDDAVKLSIKRKNSTKQHDEK